MRRDGPAEASQTHSTNRSRMISYKRARAHDDQDVHFGEDARDLALALGYLAEPHDPGTEKSTASAIPAPPSSQRYAGTDANDIPVRPRPFRSATPRKLRHRDSLLPVLRLVDQGVVVEYRCQWSIRTCLDGLALGTHEAVAGPMHLDKACMDCFSFVGVQSIVGRFRVVEGLVEGPSAEPIEVLRDV